MMGQAVTGQANTRRDYRTRRVGAFLLDIEVQRGWDGVADDVNLVMRGDTMVFGRVASITPNVRGRALIRSAFEDLRQRIVRRMANSYAGV